jgi:hypothetical protein
MCIGLAFRSVAKQKTVEFALYGYLERQTGNLVWYLMGGLDLHGIN